MAFPIAPRRFGGRRINVAPRSNAMPAPAGTGGAMQPPSTSYGGSSGGINFSGSGYGAAGAPRVGTWDHRFTDGTPGQPKVQPGVSTALNPGMQPGSAPMAFEDGGAIDDDTFVNRFGRGLMRAGSRFAKPWTDLMDNVYSGQPMTSEDMVGGVQNMTGLASSAEGMGKVAGAAYRGLKGNGTAKAEEAIPTEATPLQDTETDDTDKTTHNINAALEKVQQAFDGTRSSFGLNQGQQQGPEQDVSASDAGSDDDSGAMAYEDGGAIEDDDTTGSIDQPDDQQDLSGFQNPMGDPTAGDVPRLASYVQGAGAAPPDAVQQYLSGYNHLPKEQATVQALADAVEPSYDVGIGGFAGPQPNGMDSTSLLQGYRQHYDHGRAYAYAAANGNAQKPPNLEDSVKAANDAFPYVPDGERVHFSVGRDGVNVSIGGPNGEQRANTTLSIEQYKAFLAQSDFDNVYERTPSMMLQQVMGQDMARAGITTGPQAPVGANIGDQPVMAGSVQPQAGPDQQQGAGTPQGAGPQQSAPAKPTPENHKGYNMYTNARGTYFVPEDIDARSAALTGNWISREPERQRFINEQMQQDIKNRIDTIKANNPYGVQQLRNEGALQRTQYASSLKAAWEDRRTQGMIMINLDKIAAQHENEQARNAANLARSMLLGGQDPTDVPDAVKKMTGVDMSRLLTLGQNTPQAPNAGNSRNPPPAPAQQYGGKNTQVQAPQSPQTIFRDGKLWYKTPRGTWSDQPQ